MIDVILINVLYSSVIFYDTTPVHSASCLSDPKDTSDSLIRFDNINFYEGVLEP